MVDSQKTMNTWFCTKTHRFYGFNAVLTKALVQKWRNREDTVAWRTKKWDGPVILQTDGYAGFNAAANGGAVHAGCCRTFVDILLTR